MQRARLRNKFLKNPTNQNRLSYTKQINLCLSILRKEKQEYFSNVNEITGSFDTLPNLYFRIKLNLEKV